MRASILGALIILSGSSFCQALRDINFNYLYDPAQEFTFAIKPVRFTDHWDITFKLSVTDTLLKADELQIKWGSYESLTKKEFLPLDSTIQVREMRSPEGKTGRFSIAKDKSPGIIAARVIDAAMKKEWIFFSVLEANYSCDNFFENHVSSFALKNSELAFMEARPHILFYYNDIFPPAVPAFSEAQANVSKEIKSDSMAVVDESSVRFYKNGLYLFQGDTSKAEGFALRVEDDYPKYRFIENLFGPMIYICTRQEYDKLEKNKGNKQVFDRTILDITGDTERARKLIKNYFRRVELANRYFTSYKEGWKTDRGMIYIIFGPPDEVSRLYDKEKWNYKNSAFHIGFEFTKTGTIFDPENYVLTRDRKFQNIWYEVVDLWRNARF